MKTASDLSKYPVAAVANVRHNNLFWGGITRKVLDSWSDHDAPFILDHGKMFLGDITWSGIKLVPLEDYEEDIAKGDVEVRVYDIRGLTYTERLLASDWWLNALYDRDWFIYDFRAVLRLAAKYAFGWTSESVKDWEWAWYCTEGVKGMHVETHGTNPWGDGFSTPHTTEKRGREGEKEGELVEIT